MKYKKKKINDARVMARYTQVRLSIYSTALVVSNDTVAQAQRLNPKDLRERICLSQAPF